MSTITIRLPEEIAAKLDDTAIDSEQLNSFLVSAVNAWLLRRQQSEIASRQAVRRAWSEAFQESAVPFADQLIDENRALFEELARL